MNIMIWTALRSAAYITTLTSTADTTEQTVDDVIDSATQVTAEAGQEVNQFFQFFQDNLPNIVAFGIRVVLALVFFFIGGKVISWIRKLVRRSMDRAGADTGVCQFVDSLLKFCLYAVLIFTIATKFGVESSSVAALIASAGVAVGLALQGSLANFAGGILILILKPFVVGDYIIVTGEGIEGTVKEIQIFYTKMATVDNQTVIVPNSILTDNSLTNVTARPERQLDLKVGISYDADLRKAKRLIEDMLVNNENIIQDEDVKVFVDSLADSSVVIGLRAWVPTEKYWVTRWKLLEDIKLTFDKEGIEIPYDQLTVHVKRQDSEPVLNGAGSHAERQR